MNTTHTDAGMHASKHSQVAQQLPLAAGAKWCACALALLSLAGCFSSTRISQYPESWSPAAKVPANQCPHIAGQYVNRGATEGIESRFCSPKYPRKASWNCDAMLAGNLVKMRSVEWNELKQARSVEWLEIRQPDADSLELDFPPATGMAPKTFKRSKGDFECDAGGLKFSMSGSVLSDEKTSTAAGVASTTMAGLLILSGGVVSTERVFRPTQDGSLMMEVKESGVVVYMVGMSSKSNAFVRWEHYQPPADDLKGAAK